MESPSYLVIHHTAFIDTVQKDIVSKAHERKFGMRSWYGSYILYHLMIGKDGTVVYNRGLNERTGHTMNADINARSIAIVLNGNFNTEDPTREQLSALKKEIAKLQAIYGDLEVMPHKDASPTQCAGKHLNEWLAKEYPPKPLVQGKAIQLSRITSYNPVVEQNDASPCIGAVGIDICHYANEGVPIVALSQDLVSKNGSAPFHYGQWIRVRHHIEACDYEAVVLDTMNARFTRAVDIFRMNKDENHGLCRGGTVEPIDREGFYDMYPYQSKSVVTQ